MIYAHTLAYNVSNFSIRTIRDFYNQNKEEFEKGRIIYIIADLGYPLELVFDRMLDQSGFYTDLAQPLPKHSVVTGALAKDFVSDNLKMAVVEIFKDSAFRKNVHYLKLDNLGVQQNWTKMIEIMNSLRPIEDEDIVVCVDPDEHVRHAGWARAAELVAATGNYGWISLMMTEYGSLLAQEEKYPSKKMFIQEVDEVGVKSEVHYRDMRATFNWALGGFSGKILRLMDWTIPPHSEGHLYGWIEQTCVPHFHKHGMTWAILENHEVGHMGSHPIYSKWKATMASRPGSQNEQFEVWLAKYLAQ